MTLRTKPRGYHSLPYAERPYRDAAGVSCNRDAARFPSDFGPPTNPRRWIGGRAWKRRRAERHAAAGHPGAHDGWCSLCKRQA